MRVPLHLESAVNALIRGESPPVLPRGLSRLSREESGRSLPIGVISVPAGAFDYHTESLTLDAVDLNTWLARDPAQAHLYTVSGDSMNRAGIQPGDRLVIDRSVSPASGHIVVAWIAGEGITVKRLKVRANTLTLEPESDNPRHQTYLVVEQDELTILGVVSGVARRIV